MTVLNFPATPTDQQVYVANGISYTWQATGKYWSANTAGAGLDARYVNLSGDTMTGDLMLPSLVASGDVSGTKGTFTGDVAGVKGTFTGDVSSTGDIQSTSQNGGPLAGFRNKLVNGDFLIWQRGNPITVSASGTYTADRWYGNSGNKYTRVNFRTSPGPDGFSYGISQDGDGGLVQVVELPDNGNPGPFCVGSTWTASLWTNQNYVGKPVGLHFVDNAVGANLVAAQTPFPTWQATGETSNGFTRVSATFNITASPATSNLGLRLQAGGVAAGVLAGIQLEPGPVPTPFEHRPVATELALCQRYYQTIVALDLFPSSRGGTQILGVLVRAVEMRASPTESTATAATNVSSANVGGNAHRWVGSATQVNTGAGGNLGKVTADAEL